MLIPRIFKTLRSHEPVARGHRPQKRCSLKLESLENRTPLSSGLGAAVEPNVVVQFSAIGLAIVRPPIALEWASLEADGADQVSSTGSPAIGLSDGLPAARSESTSVSPNATSVFFSTVLIGDPDSPANTTAVSGAIALPAPASGLALGGTLVKNPRLVASQPSGVAGPIEDSTASSGTMLDRGPFDGDSVPGWQPGGPMLSLALWRGGSLATSNDDELDMSFAGTLETIETPDEPSMWMTTPMSTGHTSGRSLSFFVTEPSVPVDSSAELPGTGALSYLASAGEATLDTALLASAVDEVLAWEENATEPVLPGSITAGGLSLSVLLGGPDMPVRTDPAGLEQVVELVPLPETSLALAATLWTVSADSPAVGPRWDRPAGPDGDRAEPSQSPLPWALYMTGVDQALEQTCRDIRQGILSDRGVETGDEDSARGPDDLLEWQGPILPAAPAPRTVSDRGPTRPDRAHALENTDDRSARTTENSKRDSSDGPRVVLGAMPMLSVVSISTVIAGWFWKKRRQSRRPGQAENASRGSWERVPGTERERGR